MKTYNVIYNTKEESIKIGVFYMLKFTQKFVPDYDGINRIEALGYSVLGMLTEEINEPKIKFFDSLIKNCERFGGKITSHVNNYELIAINEDC